MPNQRSKDKVILSNYVPRELKADIRAWAKSAGQSMATIQTAILTKAVADWKRKRAGS